MNPSAEILYFTGTNCRICKLMTPLVVEAAEGFDGEVRFIPLDATENSSRASDYNVMAVPTIVAVSDGREVGRVVGAQTPGAIKRLFGAAASGVPAKHVMNPRDRMLRLGFAFALGVLAMMTGQVIVWPLASIALIAAFWDKRP
jgi:thioredoxin-like negative regulator of GroEL